MDSSAGREDHREQIGLDVEAATRRYIIGRFDLGSRRGVAALGMRRAGASSPVIILWHAKCAARRFLAPDNRMRVGVVAQPSFKLYPWRPAILTPSTPSSPKASIRSIRKRPRRCWRNWRLESAQNHSSAMPALRRPSITRSQAARTRGSALAGGESACAALMVFVNESELPWDFWSSQPMRQLHLVIRRISLVSERARMGRMLCDEHL